jgi:hypothetical protein
MLGAHSTGRFDPSFGILAVAELRGAADAAEIAHATVAALKGRDAAMSGAGPRRAIRGRRSARTRASDAAASALLKKAGDALDAAYLADTAAARHAAPDDAGGALVGARSAPLRSLGRGTYVSPALGVACMPASSVAARRLQQSDDRARRRGMRFFAIVRALRSQAAAGLSRLAPIDLWPVMAAFLSQFAPNWQPAAVDAKRMADARERIRPVMPRHVDDDVPVLALEVIGSIGNRASQLAISIGQWGDRAGLLAIGDPSVAIRGIAFAGGHNEGPPAEGPERLKWIVRNPEAGPDFSVSDNYVEARRKLGLG